jgi:hypothetical protein
MAYPEKLGVAAIGAGPYGLSRSCSRHRCSRIDFESSIRGLYFTGLASAQSNDSKRADFLGSVADVDSWSEPCGGTGILMYSDDSQIEPWFVSQLIPSE